MELKVRVWSKVENKFLDESSYFWRDGEWRYFINPYSYESELLSDDNFRIDYYTNVKDFLGREIYTKDKVYVIEENIHGENYEVLADVVFANGSFKTSHEGRLHSNYRTLTNLCRLAQ